MFRRVSSEQWRAAAFRNQDRISEDVDVTSPTGWRMSDLNIMDAFDHRLDAL